MLRSPEYLPDSVPEARAENPEVLKAVAEGKPKVSGKLLKSPILVATSMLLVFLLFLAVFHWLSRGLRSSTLSSFFSKCLF